MSPAGRPAPAPRRHPGTNRVVDSGPSLKQRARDVRRRRLKVLGIVLLGLALLAGVGWLGWMSPLLAVHKVAVIGVGGDDANDIIHRAGIREGTPLLRINPDEVHDRVLGRVNVAEASVERSWPSTVVIKVLMRHAVLAVKDPDGRFRLVDRAGTQFDTVDQAPDGVPVATAPGESGLSKEALSAAVSVVQSLPEAMASSLKSITVASPYDVTLRINDVEVKWGGAADAAKKARVVEVLLKKTHPRRIDVSAPDTPVVG